MPPKSSGEIQMLFLSRWAYNSEPLIKEITRRTSKEQRTTQRRLISHFWPKFRYTLTRLVATCVYTGRIIYCSPAVFWVREGDRFPFSFLYVDTQTFASFETHQTTTRPPRSSADELRRTRTLPRTYALRCSSEDRKTPLIARWLKHLPCLSLFQYSLKAIFHQQSTLIAFTYLVVSWSVIGFVVIL